MPVGVARQRREVDARRREAVDLHDGRVTDRAQDIFVDHVLPDHTKLPGNESCMRGMFLAHVSFFVGTAPSETTVLLSTHFSLRCADSYRVAIFLFLK